MNPYYKLYVYFLGPKILTEIETLKAKLEKGACSSVTAACWYLFCSSDPILFSSHWPVLAFKTRQDER